MITFESIKPIIIQSWSRESSWTPNDWTPENPSRGQCFNYAGLTEWLLDTDIVKCFVQYILILALILAGCGDSKEKTYYKKKFYYHNGRSSAFLDCGNISASVTEVDSMWACFFKLYPEYKPIGK